MATIILVIVGTQTPIFQKFLRRQEERKAVPVVRKDLELTIFASGTLRGDLAVLSFQTGGKVSWVGVSEGDEVRRGQALISLDTTKLNADYQRTLSDLRSAQATLGRVYDEVKGHDLDETFKQKETRTIAEVAKDKDHEAVIKAKKDLGDAVLFAPFSGIVTKISDRMVVGGSVSTTDSITLVGTSRMKFTALVDEVDYGRIKLGQKVKLILDAFPGETFEGKVEAIKRFTDNSKSGATVVPVDIRIDADPRFIPGLSGEAEFVIEA